MLTQFFSREIKSQALTRNRNYRQLAKDLQEDTLRNGQICSEDFKSIISILQEEIVCFGSDDLHRFLANLWSLPNLLDESQRKQICNTMVHAQLYGLKEESALILADALDLIAKKNDIEGYLNELGKNVEMVSAVEYIKNRHLLRKAKST